MRLKKFPTLAPLWLLVPLATAGIAFQHLRDAQHGELRARQSAVAVVDETVGWSPLDRRRPTDPMLAEAILSIVQSYYVDRDRVSPRHLISSVLASLSREGLIKVDEDERSFTLTSGTQKVVAEWPKSLRIDELLKVLTIVAGFLDRIAEDSVEGSGDQQQLLTVVDRMLVGLDAHSSLLLPMEYQELRQGTEGAFGGLGVLVGMKEHLLTVIKPIPKSPAERAGVQRFDRIVGINGVATFGYSLDELVDYMRGDPGTKVNLSMLREGEPAPYVIALSREIIRVDSVEVRTIEEPQGQVLHLIVDTFSSRTSREVMTAIKEARESSKPLAGVILDLRMNPGGLLDQAVQVADLFLEEGTIVTTRGRREEVEAADYGYREVDFPVMVLIDSDSASASEIVAGALQDHGRALVIGQPSFGKGSVQTIFELPRDHALKLTIARYYTPLGRSIQNVGIRPDIWMQPIVRNSENLNLLGEYRYKSERFLPNHLLSQGSRSIDRRSTPPTYYLADPPNPFLAEREESRELDLAREIIRRVNETFGVTLSGKNRHADEWLAVSASEIDRFRGLLQEGVQAWVKKDHNLDWGEPRGADPSGLVLTSSQVNPIVATPGEELSIPWRLRNLGGGVGRVSVFLAGDREDLETQEVLVGFVPKAAIRRGTIKLSIPTYWPPGLFQMRLGLAVDGEPSNHHGTVHTIRIRSRVRPQLMARARLINEVGGEVKGTLEPMERADLQIVLHNQGEVVAEDVEVVLVNLIGDQVKILGESTAIAQIKPDESKAVRVAIQGSSRIVNGNLSLGIAVNTNDLELPLRQRISIRGSPNQSRPRLTNLLKERE